MDSTEVDFSTPGGRLKLLRPFVDTEIGGREPMSNVQWAKIMPTDDPNFNHKLGKLLKNFPVMGDAYLVVSRWIESEYGPEQGGAVIRWWLNGGDAPPPVDNSGDHSLKSRGRGAGKAAYPKKLHYYSVGKNQAWKM